MERADSQVELQGDGCIDFLLITLMPGKIGNLMLHRTTGNLSGTHSLPYNTHQHSQDCQNSTNTLSAEPDALLYFSWHQSVLKCKKILLSLLIFSSVCVLIFCLSSSPAESHYYCCRSNLISPQASSII